MSVVNSAIKDQILTITLARPQALNALNQEVIGVLRNVFLENVIQDDYKGIIITGAGEKAFAAGADIKEFTGLDAKNATKLSLSGKEVFDAIERSPKPVIAAVNGFALGGGLELAMACHIRIASDNARFGLPEVNLGILPGYSGTQRLAHLIGKGRALSMTLTADMIDAETALQYGLVTQVVAISELQDVSRKAMKKILAKGPLAIEKSIQAILAAYSKDAADMLESQSFGELAASDDFKEGVLAFIEKRKANFKGQ